MATLTRIRLPFGGTYQIRSTLLTMRKIVREQLRNPDLVSVAVNVVRGVDGRSASVLVTRIDAWARSRIGFLPDPAIVGDYLRTPEYVLKEIRQYGRARIDCDDAAMLVAFVAMAVGIPARFRAVAFFTRNAPFSHVWTELDVDGKWVRVDPVANQFDNDIPVTRSMIVGV